MRYWVLCLIVLLSACSKTIYVPTESSHTEIQYVDKVRIDTLEHFRDRVVMQKGDTVYDVTTEYIRDYKEVHDTCLVFRADTIEVPVEVPTIWQKKLSWWEQTRLKLFWPIVASLVIVIIWVFRKSFLRLILK